MTECPVARRWVHCRVERIRAGENKFMKEVTESL